MCPLDRHMFATLFRKLSPFRISRSRSAGPSGRGREATSSKLPKMTGHHIKLQLGGDDETNWTVLDRILHEGA